MATDVDLPDFPSHLFNDADPETAQIRGLHEQATKGLQSVRDALFKAADDINQLKVKWLSGVESSKWHQDVEASVGAYNRLVSEYEKKGSELGLAAYEAWVRRRNQLQNQLNSLAAIRKESSTLDQRLDMLLGQMQQLRADLFNKRKSFLESTIGSSDYVRMDLVQYGDVSTIERDYRHILGLEDHLFVQSVCDHDGKRGMLWSYYNWESAGIPELELADHLAAIKEKTIEVAQGLPSGFHGHFDNRLQHLLETQPSALDRLNVELWPEDLLRVSYSKDPNSDKFESLEKGSAGQKAAAILAFVLSHGDEPLIIDQPEDDLDNALIYDLIVQQIHENKSRRQLIVVTHNPNIVVNGDAELVHILKFQGGQVQCDNQGGLEEASIRDAICAIMEGGKQAFEKRYKRITLEV